MGKEGRGEYLGRSLHGVFFDLFDSVFRHTEILDAVAPHKAFVQLQLGGGGK
jgi:hypothetical protein